MLPWENWRKTSACLHLVARATTIAQLLYASFACWDLTIESDRSRIDRFHKRLRRSDYIPDDAPSITELVDQGDDRLLRSTESNPLHVIRELLPPKVIWSYELRPRPHN